MKKSLVQSGRAIFVINDLKNIRVTANFEETTISRISVTAYPDFAFKDRVEHITGAIVTPAFSVGEFKKTTQRIPIRISFSNLPEGRILLPGMSVVVKVHSR